jgi:hypothetical protein
MSLRFCVVETKAGRMMMLACPIPGVMSQSAAKVARLLGANLDEAFQLRCSAQFIALGFFI